MSQPREYWEQLLTNETNFEKVCGRARSVEYYWREFANDWCRLDDDVITKEQMQASIDAMVERGLIRP